jgi:hypothetical protein
LGREKKVESYGWLDRHTTSRRMWSMLASRKGIKQNVTRPFGRRRAISESSIPSQSMASFYLAPPVISYVDVGFGIMIPDDPEQGHRSHPAQRMDGLVGLHMSKSSSGIKKKPSRRVTGGKHILRDQFKSCAHGRMSRLLSPYSTSTVSSAT